MDLSGKEKAELHPPQRRIKVFIFVKKMQNILSLSSASYLDRPLKRRRYQTAFQQLADSVPYVHAEHVHR